jgi:hypothetical protein
MKSVSSLVLIAGIILMSCGRQPVTQQEVKNELRAPAYPLVMIDPYTSAWSFTDTLFKDPVRHWTGKVFSLGGAVRVDGVVYRFMGVEDPYSGTDLGSGDGSGDNVINGSHRNFSKTAVQKSVTLMPTQTYYLFGCGGTELSLLFTSPLLMDDLDLLSRPVNYLSWAVRSTDGRKHSVQVYFDATPQWAVNEMTQKVMYNDSVFKNISYARTGTIEQPVLQKKGDDLRIDWGWLYLASGAGKVICGDYDYERQQFISGGEIKEQSPSGQLEQDMSKKMGALSYCTDAGKVSSETVKGFLMIGYDDIFSVQYFGENLRPYWNRAGNVKITDMLEKAGMEYDQVMEKCRKFDDSLMSDAIRAGGQKYASLCALVYRQSIAAHKLTVDNKGILHFFSKENFSNGSIGTVDVTYPSAPLFLVYNPELAKGLLNHVFYYSESGQWTKPFAAHDIGTYPLGNGQTYQGDMPVEECGNMLILTNAIARREGNADYALKHWDVLTLWTAYLEKAGMDPENQLCTDDFAGHLAHNANLSVKAIIGIASYAQLAEMAGKKVIASKYMTIAREMAARWEPMANNGDHYRLAFDKPDTWSQKYNLVWDKVFGTHLFPPSIAEKEVKWYLSRQTHFGLPLDSRKTYTKSDWIMWTACLADNDEDFKALTDPVYNYANETESRMPLSDWHETTTGKWINMRARSVVGGYFMKMLLDKSSGK